MRIVLLTLLSFFVISIRATSVFPQAGEMRELRNLYYEGFQNKHTAVDFYEKLKTVDQAQPVKLGYKGMASLLLAYHAWNPLQKLKNFIDGRNDLEKAIELEPENIELRFLRFTVQTNVPEFLNYRRNIVEDKRMLLDSFLSPDEATIDQDLRKRIYNYMLETKYCTRIEKQDLSNVQMMSQEE